MIKTTRVKGLIRRGEYYDSISLMMLAAQLRKHQGVLDAAVVMGTESNIAILKKSGLWTDELAAATENDLLVAVKIKTETEKDEQAFAEFSDDQFSKTIDKEFVTFNNRFNNTITGSTACKNQSVTTIDEATQNLPDANLAIISVAGRYAAAVAKEALEKNLNVLLFSDNVSIEEELSLKKLAQQRNLLVMGPDCGTAIIEGVPLAFANKVRIGKIGIIAASGTGLQEVSTIISNAGRGISNALGTGGRDLSKEISGATFLQALTLLERDPQTEVILLISKPPHPQVMEKIQNAIKKINKPTVSLFLGQAGEAGQKQSEQTLEDVAYRAIALSEAQTITERSDSDGSGGGNGGHLLQGFFTGGTFASEAKILLTQNQNIIDFGDDQFTEGRPHPMIDYTLRNQAILQASNDPNTAIIMLDYVLGYGSNPDPLAESLPILQKVAAKKTILATVVGTPSDPQNSTLVRNKLLESGVIVLNSNAQMCLLAKKILDELARPLVLSRVQTLPRSAQAAQHLWKKPLSVINIGIRSFLPALEANQVPHLQLDWRPASAEGTNANKECLKRIQAARPLLVGMGIALETIPGMRKNLFLHAGPPIEWTRMCGPMQGAIIGAILYEKKARDFSEAQQLAASGAIEFAPAHEYAAVGPMAGIISPSMPVFIVKNETFSNYAYTTMNEGLGKVLRYGAYDESVIQRLDWMQKVLYPALKSAIGDSGVGSGIDLKAIAAQALHMGDELHNRNRAATSLIYRILAPLIPQEVSREVLNFINSNDHFFLNLSMAMCKSALDPLSAVKGSSIITVMARNGTDFGIKVAGLGDGKEWFTGPAPIPEALFFPGYSRADANPDIGDSAITETFGLGGMAMAAAPSIVQFIGGSASDAEKYTKEMYQITCGENNSLQIPYLNFKGVPAAIDLLKVIEKNIFPVINTGVAHRLAGIGQIGAGILRAPTEPFQKAFKRFKENRDA
ncbi:MAG: acyl-CoA synthetase FdrA [Oligoflexia bacterium]|nr:acyl-CoA synthetase FdrA [Oligoflexia bacterium]